MSDQLTSDLNSLRIDRETPRPRSRAWISILILLLIGGAGAAAFVTTGPALKAKFFKPEVELTEISIVSPMQAAVQLTATGYVVPQRVSKVAAKLSGRIEKVLVKEGDAVKEGDVMLILEKTERAARINSLESRVAAAKAAAQAARANLLEVNQQLAREKALAQKGVSARSVAEDLLARRESLEAAAQAAEAQVKVAQSEVQSLKIELSLLTVKAPINGTVISKPPAPGDVSSMEFGQGPVIELADFSSLAVEADVPESRLYLIKVGSPTEIILDASPNVRRPGEVLEISRKINRAKATALIKVKFTGDIEGVLPEMAARVNFLSKPLDEKTAKEPPKTVVPLAAVTERDGMKFVFTFDEGTLRRRPIVLGETLGSAVELREGPIPGTKVVKNPAAFLTDGQAVKERTK